MSLLAPLLVESEAVWHVLGELGIAQVVLGLYQVDGTDCRGLVELHHQVARTGLG